VQGFGFRVFWANRAGAPREQLPGQIAAEMADLSPLPELLQA